MRGVGSPQTAARGSRPTSARGAAASELSGGRISCAAMSVSPSSHHSILARFRQGVVVALALATLLYVGYALTVGAKDVAALLVSYSWPWFGVILGLSLTNYVIRFARWELFLRLLDIRVPRASSALIFAAGLAMTITPGKVGEFLKSYLLKERHGVPMATSAPVIFVERVGDLLALILLASVGVTAYGGPRSVPVLAVAGGLVVGGLVVLQSRSLTDRALKIVARLPLGTRVAPKLRELLDSSQALLRPGALIPGLGLAVAAWMCEATGFWLVFRGFPEPVHVPVGLSTFAYSFSMVAGVVSPGGLGPADIGLIEITRAFADGLSHEVATAASFLCRLATLWFAVILGALALLRFRSEVEVDADVARGAG